MQHCILLSASFQSTAPPQGGAAKGNNHRPTAHATYIQLVYIHMYIKTRSAVSLPGCTAFADYVHGRAPMNGSGGLDQSATLSLVNTPDRRYVLLSAK